MFIVKRYELEMEAPGCHPGSETWNATAHLEEDMDAVFPYLNAVWEEALYSPAGRQLAVRRGDHRVALKPREITITNLADRDAAAIEMEALIAEINHIWLSRDTLTPRQTPRRRLVAMEIYKLLPHTNCKLCGQASCFAFAGQLTVGAACLEDCSPLAGEPQYLPQYQSLQAMLAEAD
jgi:ArsR family metal-binding transcriptional regulator